MKKLYLLATIVAIIGFSGYIADIYNYFGYTARHFAGIHPITALWTSFFLFFAAQVFRKNWKGIGVICLFFYSVYVFISRWVPAVLSNFELIESDGALRLLGHFYTRAGLVPYKDFIYPYGPGLFFLPFFSVMARNATVAMVSILLISFCCISIVRMVKKPIDRLFYLSLLLLLNRMVADFVWSDPIVLMLLASLLVFSQKVISRSPNTRIYLFTIAVSSLLIVLLRWNWIVQLVVVEAVLFGFTWVRYRGGLQPWGLVILSQISGLFFGGIILLGYLQEIGALEGWIASTRAIIATSSYTHLPFSVPTSLWDAHGIFIYSSLIALVMLVVSVRKRWVEAGPLIAFPVSMIAYSMVRLEWTRIFPLTYLVSIVWIIRSIILSKPKYQSLLFIGFILLTFVSGYLPNWPLVPKKKNAVTAILRKELSDCAQKTPSSESYQSLFVGRTSYSRFYYGTTALYFLNPKVAPASSFIADNPGIQNSCTWGKVITNQLAVAPKPMLVLLDTHEGPTEPNKTETMTSCGVIEKFLNEQQHSIMGTCIAYDREFEIRMYQ